MSSMDEISTAMAEAVAADSRLKDRFNAQVVFDIDGERYSLDCRTKASQHEEGTATADTAASVPSVDNLLEVRASLQTLQELLSRSTTPQKAFMQGKLKIKGKMSLAMKLTMILDATRQRLATSQHSRL